MILSRKARIEADAAPAESRSGGAGAGAGAAPKRKKKRKKDDDDDPAFVADLLKWFSRCKSLVDNEFSGHSHYSNALRVRPSLALLSLPLPVCSLCPHTTHELVLHLRHRHHAPGCWVPLMWGAPS